MHPFPKTISRMIKMYRGNPKKVLELFDYHWKTVLPDRNSFEASVWAYLELEDFIQAREQYDRMIERGYLATQDLANRIHALE